jgi:hypothetical protein
VIHESTHPSFAHRSSLRPPRSPSLNGAPLSPGLHEPNQRGAC